MWRNTEKHVENLMMNEMVISAVKGDVFLGDGELAPSFHASWSDVNERRV